MRLITVGVYGACALAALALATWSRRHPERVRDVGSLLDQLLAARAARVTLLVFWWWIGWHFLVG